MEKLMSEKRIAWAITGAGHTLEECIDVLLNYERVDVFLSRAAEEVLGMYNLDSRISVPKIRIYQEAKSSSPHVVRLFAGTYSVLVIAPATSNSVAKFVYGISDTLATNLFAQAGKSRIPVVAYPTDLAPVMNSAGPRGQSFKVYPRPIDLENTTKLRTFPGVTVVGNGQELERAVADFA
jgi:dihydromethanopterin reductase (acceptor)